MVELPSYLSRVNPTVPMPSRPSWKCAASDAEVEKTKVAFGSSRAKKTKASDAQGSTHSTPAESSLGALELTSSY